MKPLDEETRKKLDKMFDEIDKKMEAYKRMCQKRENRIRRLRGEDIILR